MEQNEALELYRRTGAYLEGHFRLSSGLHSTGYLQSALVLQHPADAASLGCGIAAHVKQLSADGRAVAGARRPHHRPRSGARARRARDLRRARGRNRADAAPRIHARAERSRARGRGCVHDGQVDARDDGGRARAGADVVGAAAIVDRSGGDDRFRRAVVRARAARRARPTSPRQCPLCAQGVAGGEAGVEAADSGSDRQNRSNLIDAHFQSHARYDGTDFSGFQRQANARSVQAELEAALAAIEGKHVTVAGAGRTDAGVHALGQVASFKLSSAIADARSASGAQREAARRCARAVGRRGGARFQRALFRALEDVSLPHQQHARDEPVPAPVRVAHLARRSIWPR